MNVKRLVFTRGVILLLCLLLVRPAEGQQEAQKRGEEREERQ